MANADQLLVRAACVVDEPNTPVDGVAGRWEVVNSCLVLRHPGWLAYFATKADLLPAGQARPSLPLGLLRDRAEAVGMRMTDVKIEQSEFAISIQSLQDADVADSPEFTGLASQDSSSARRAAVALPSGRNLVVELVKGTASIHTNAMSPLAEVGSAALGLLTGSTDVFGAQALRLDEDRDDSAGPSASQPPLWGDGEDLS